MMKTLVLAGVLGSLMLAGAVQAGSSQGTGARLPIAVEGTAKPENYGFHYAVPMPVRRNPDGIVPLAAGVVPQTSWNPFGTVSLTPGELAAQLRINRAWNDQQARDFVAGDGCEGGFLAVFVSSWCWNRDYRG